MNANFANVSMYSHPHTVFLDIIVPKGREERGQRVGHIWLKRGVEVVVAFVLAQNTSTFISQNPQA